MIGYNELEAQLPLSFLNIVYHINFTEITYQNKHFVKVE